MSTEVVNPDRHETYARVLTKKIRRIDLSLDVGNLADLVVWRPPSGRQHILLAAYLRTDEVVGTPSAARVNLQINDVDVVASVAVPATAGLVTTLTVVDSKPFSYTNPLTLTSIDEAAAGANPLFVELILVAVDLADIFGS